MSLTEGPNGGGADIISGTVTSSDYVCIAGMSVSGAVIASTIPNTLVLDINDDSEMDADVSGTVNQVFSSMSDIYYTSQGFPEGDSGTWSATRN
jgi:hypothetical protein